MTCSIIHVDFKARQKLYTETRTPVGDKKPGIDIAANKRVVNDLKAMLDGLVEEVDLGRGVLLLPAEPQDLYVKLDGTDLASADIQAIGRIHRKMRERDVKPGH